jgi:hypothetical protein
MTTTFGMELRPHGRPGRVEDAPVVGHGGPYVTGVASHKSHLRLRLQLQGENAACLEARDEAGGMLVNDAAKGKFKARAIP